MPNLALGDDDVAVAMTDQDVGLAAAVEELAASPALPIRVQVA
jgi:hypothetical protein